jgi:hypothetical protein
VVFLLLKKKASAASTGTEEFICCPGGQRRQRGETLICQRQPTFQGKRALVEPRFLEGRSRERSEFRSHRRGLQLSLGYGSIQRG